MPVENRRSGHVFGARRMVCNRTPVERPLADRNPPWPPGEPSPSYVAKEEQAMGYSACLVV